MLKSLMNEGKSIGIDISSKYRWQVVKSGMIFKGSGKFEGGGKIIELQVQ